jgi:hypothetical protein
MYILKQGPNGVGVQEILHNRVVFGTSLVDKLHINLRENMQKLVKIL